MVRLSRQQMVVAFGEGGSGRHSGEMGRFERYFLSRGDSTCSWKWVSDERTLGDRWQAWDDSQDLGLSLPTARSRVLLEMGHLSKLGLSLLQHKGTRWYQGLNSRPRSHADSASNWM